MNITLQTRWIPPPFTTNLQTGVTSLVASPLPPPKEPPPETARSVRLMTNLGMTPEEIAKQLNGTRHTAGIDDLRLAHHVTAVALEEIEAERNPASCRAAFQAFFGVLRTHIQSRMPLAHEDLLRLVGAVDGDLAESLKLAIRNDKLRIEITSGQDFDAKIRKWGQVPSCCLSFYDGTGAIPTILIRALETSSHPFEERLERSLGLVHEARHWKDFRGTPRLRIPRFFGHRKARYVSEILAYQEEHRFLVRCGNFKMSDRACAKGLTLAEHLRERVYQEYFGWRWTKKLFPF